MALFNILGGGSRGGGMSPLTLALLGVLAYRTMHGEGRLAKMLGTAGNAGSGTPPGSVPPGGEPGGVGGLGSLGGILGGVLGGGALSGGLQDLIDRFRQNGHGDKAESWVSTSANTPVAPHELEQALGNDRIDWLVHETGMPRDQLLAGLSTALPEAVDKLTPDGRVPSEQELSGLLSSG